MIYKHTVAKIKWHHFQPGYRFVFNILMLPSPADRLTEQRVLWCFDIYCRISDNI